MLVEGNKVASANEAAALEAIVSPIIKCYISVIVLAIPGYVIIGTPAHNISAAVECPLYQCN
jgi:hypothetical protein